MICVAIGNVFEPHKAWPDIWLCSLPNSNYDEYPLIQFEEKKSSAQSYAVSVACTFNPLQFYSMCSSLQTKLESQVWKVEWWGSNNVQRMRTVTTGVGKRFYVQNVKFKKGKRLSKLYQPSTFIIGPSNQLGSASALKISVPAYYNNPFPSLICL